MAAAKKSAPRRAATQDETIIENGAETAFAAAGAWGEAARDQYETALKSFADNAEQLRVQAEEAMQSARESFDAANDRMRSVNAEVMAAARTEMTEAVEFANELARAKSFADALEIQRGYWTKLYEARIERARALTEASTEAAREAFEPFSRSFGGAFAFAPSFDKFFPFSSK